MTSICEICGQSITDAVTAVMHYERLGRRSPCDLRVERVGRLDPGPVVSLGSGLDARRRRLTL